MLKKDIIPRENGENTVYLVACSEIHKERYFDSDI